MDKNGLKYLFRRYFDNTCTRQEQQQLMQLLAVPVHDETFKELMDSVWLDLSPDYRLNEQDKEEVLQQLLDRRKNVLPVVQRVHFLKRVWFRYAAAILMLSATGAYLWFQHSRRQMPAVAYRPLPSGALPGKTGAVLTLANGKQVVLDSLANGTVATQNGVQAVLNNGQLTYDKGQVGNAEIAYNTLATPNGRQFQLVLPDGTKVWLNAASSLRYPVAFSEKDRRIEITGEAYFEIMPDKTKPFFVRINNRTTVEVLGTSFNINAYEDEAAINTTLIAGSILVGERKAPLLPAEQAQVDKNGTITVLPVLNTEAVTAWKNGYFSFDKTELPAVMRQLARWYNVRFEYRGGPPQVKFGGEISRNARLTEVLRILEESNIHFTIEKEKIIVHP